MLPRHGFFSEAIETPAKLLADGASFFKGSSFGSSSGSDRHLHSSMSLPGPNLDINSDRLERYNFSLRPSPGNGLGLFTNEDIPKGETLVIERPVLILGSAHGELIKKKQANPDMSWDEVKADYLQKELDKLPKSKQGEIWSLYNHTENSKEFPLLSIFRTNAFGFSDHEGLTGIYVFCARINHSCDPNCGWNISQIPESNDPGDCVIRVTAAQNLKAGDELTITYTFRENRVEERQTELLRSYGFKCSCPRCVFEQCSLERLYAWPFDGQQKARLRFNPVRPRHVPGDGQGWDFFTTIEHISGNDATIHPNDVITQEKPLILLTKDETEMISGSLILERFQQLSSSRRKAYLRLYNRQSKPSISLSPEVDSWASYDLESTDEETSAGKEKSKCAIGSLKGGRSTPLPEMLLDKWSTNSFHLNHGMQAVFSFISHLEHSCSPTCKVVWCDEEQTLNLVALRPLKVGGRVTICYRCEIISNFPVRERQWYLKEHYDFDCPCFRCYLDLSDANTVGPNIDPLPLSEILAAGEDTDCKPSAKSSDFKHARPTTMAMPIPSRGFAECFEENSQSGWRDQTARKRTFSGTIPEKRRSRPEKSLSPLRDSMMGRLGERMWRNENKRSAETQLQQL